jgi:hypothetical protein
MVRLLRLILAIASLAEAHIVFTYPGTRGNNLITNETFPYAMQWNYPCSSLPTKYSQAFAQSDC